MRFFEAQNSRKKRNERKKINQTMNAIEDISKQIHPKQR